MSIMSRNCITSMHIQKLGHKIEEIRIRALENIISKLDHGFVYDNDITCSRELLTKLFEWFNFKPCPIQEKVLQLISRILESSNSQTYIDYVGHNNIVSELKGIRECIEPKYYKLIDDMIIHFNEKKSVIPHLDLGSVPLSYRSDNELYTTRTAASQELGTTASPINTYVIENSTPHLLLDGDLKKSSEVSYQSPSISSPHLPNVTVMRKCIPHSLLPWQPLVLSDRHVLSSVETSLSDSSNVTILLHSCNFFHDVLLQDFPAEVFLQRPGIIKLFFNLIKENQSSRVFVAILKCLHKLTELLHIRVHYYSDPATHNLKQENCTTDTSSDKDPLSASNFTKSSRNECQEYYTNVRNEVGDNTSDCEDTVLLQLQQITLPKYCLQTLLHVFSKIGFKPTSVRNVHKIKMEHTNLLLNLSAEIIRLISICIQPTVWEFQADSVVNEVINLLNLLLDKISEVINSLRLFLQVNELKPENRAAYLYLLVLTKSFLNSVIPLKNADVILPQIFKETLASCLLDAPFSKLYPNIHEEFYIYIKEFGGRLETDVILRHKDIKKICESMSAAIKVLRDGSSYNSPEIFKLISLSLPSLEFHRNMNIIKTFVETCINKLTKWKLDDQMKLLVEDITSTLLGHTDIEIKLSMYSTCHLYVVGVLGVDHVLKSGPGRPGECLTFMWSSKVMIEIVCHGLSSENAQVQRYAEDIILYILKGKILVTSSVWQNILVSIIPALPLLQCYADKTTPLGRSIAKMLDPDIAQTISLPTAEVMKGNLRLLFSGDSLSRNESVSRLTWLLATEEKANEKLPSLKSLQGPILNTICYFEKNVDLTKDMYFSHTFYQVSSLLQVLDLLSSSGLEPSVRKSAISQISVMLQDRLLHKSFLDQDGLSLILRTFTSALTEKDYHTYPDSVVPIISMLKNLCIHNPSVRQTLYLKVDIYYLIFRALLLFSGNDSLRYDGAQLLSLLLFNDFLITVPGTNGGKISFVALILDRLHLPFTCRTHWRNSRHSKPILSVSILSDEISSSFLRFHWNTEWYGGFSKLLLWEKVPTTLMPEELAEFNGDLRLRTSDLALLKYSSPIYCCQQYLFDIQNASTHQAVLDSVNGLIIYVLLQAFRSKSQFNREDSIETLPWEITFNRFLLSSPSSIADTDLLIIVLSFLRLLNKLFKKHGQNIWIMKIFKDTNHCLLKLLQPNEDNSLLEKNLSRELLMLLTECASNEQYLMDAKMSPFIEKTQSLEIKQNDQTWLHVVQLITENLKFSDTQHFYNLAYLDWLLCCLVQVTATLGWSSSSLTNIDSKRLRIDLINCLTELVGAFHCGKGTEATTSLMGLSITRNAVLTMNHILFEMQFTAEKGWEQYWLCESENCSEIDASLHWLASLWSSRDVILRAATFQLLAGLASTRRGATEVVRGLREVYPGGVWISALTKLLDQNEASIVREQAAVLLTNLCSHSSTNGSISSLPLCHGPIFSEDINMTASDAVLTMLEKCNFYLEVGILIQYLYLDVELDSLSLDFQNLNLETQSGQCIPPSNSKKDEYMLVYRKRIQSHRINSASSTESLLSPDCLSDPGIKIIITPSLIKAIAWYFINMIILTPEAMVLELNQHSLIRGFFRCVSKNKIDIIDSRSLALYMDIIEMNTAICTLLAKAVSHSKESHSTVLHLKDSLFTLLSLLNPAMFYNTQPHLIYLRNHLWTEIFKLITTLLNYDHEITTKCYQEQGYFAISNALNECGHDQFLEALCESITSNSPELQDSAISSLTALLCLETYHLSSPNILKNDTNSEFSLYMQNILDSVKSPRQYFFDENFENMSTVDTILKEHSKCLSNKTQHSKHKMSKEINGIHEDKKALRNMKTYRKQSLPSPNLNNPKASKFKLVDHEENMIGAELCRMLIRLYNVHSLKNNYAEGTVSNSRSKNIVVSALTSLLCVSQQAKKAALDENFLDTILKQLRELYVRLSLESIDYVKLSNERKKICPVLNELSNMIGLVTNFFFNDNDIKNVAVAFGFADLIHKMWVWLTVQRPILIQTLKMLCTFTTDCLQASQSITLTSPVAGVGPRKSPSNVSLLHVIVTFITREMELINRSHDLTAISLAFHLLQNCCQAQECRVLLAKSNILQSLARLHPAITKHQKPWESVELLWLEFLESLTYYSEGQICVAKSVDALELIMALTSSSKLMNKMSALTVLRNIAFNQINRPRLLSSVEFLHLLNTKLVIGTIEEKCMCVTIIWSLAANSQKAKLVLKSASLEIKLQEVLKQLMLSDNSKEKSRVYIDNVKYVLKILNDGR